MAYDLRDYIEVLRNAGELVEINDEVDWNYEISAYEVMSGRVGGPAFLFNKIKDIPEGPRVLAGHFHGDHKRPFRKAALTLGLDPTLDRVGFAKVASQALGSMLKPVEVSTGECKEVIKMGKDVNLTELPFTYHAIGDGGKYIMMNAVTIKDPDSDWMNTGNYAIEVFSKNRLVVTPYAQSNFVGLYTTKYQARGEAMPVAIIIGGDPVLNMAAGMILPPGVSEYDAAGGLRRTPLEMVKCETSDILVPANAEVIIEGEVRPYERLPEGPKTEVFNFSVGPRQPFYAIRVHCITYRKNPIVPDIHCALGCGVHSLMDSFMQLGYLGQIKAFQVPIKYSTGSTPAKTGGTIYNAIKKDKYPESYPGFMEDLYDRVTGLPGMGGIFAHSLFVDDDVNVLDYGDVIEAQFTQTNPARDLIKTDKMFPTMTIESSWMEAEDREKNIGPGTILSNKMLTDATTKEEPPMGVRRMQFETVYPKEIQQWVVDNWSALGFEEEVLWHNAWLEAKF
jgi:4-hydroxy-3-polyprenylbenzoate decarboxylase